MFYEYKRTDDSMVKIMFEQIPQAPFCIITEYHIGEKEIEIDLTESIAINMDLISTLIAKHKLFQSNMENVSKLLDQAQAAILKSETEKEQMAKYLNKNKQFKRIADLEQALQSALACVGNKHDLDWERKLLKNQPEQKH